MPVKSYRPTTPTRRFTSVLERNDITKDKPEKSLTIGKRKTGGRNSSGHVTSRFIGGGQIGFNYQIGRVVLGVEGDYSWSNIKQETLDPFVTSRTTRTGHFHPLLADA